MTKTLTVYTPTQALKAVHGLKKTRFYEMMKDGSISYQTTDSGRLIDGSELSRVFSDKFSPLDEDENPISKNTPEIDRNEQSRNQELTERTLVAETESRLLREQLSSKDDEIRYLRNQLEEAGEERRKLTALLSAPKEEPREPEKKSWFKRVMGG